ncbi:TonB-denpendent receptor [Opitutus terrae]|uniref:TonB-dependent receptor plug n=1 Tax=Opitutus terrae (strain DSM 11246 / JCM 15787 / PB90-1) TaxID=452637 RepID=B1ZP62_OPITP|nr:TonB-denpendent receptor [Opitutus terrae]ACB77551.1 TonB-dependent receptor plug [Opitutus terrae PB90-1]
MTPQQPPPTLPRFLLAPACLFGLTAVGLAQQSAPASASATAPRDEEVVVLSPFEVVSDTRGYYSANTMSGTRFNTKIDDLASSITIMTKEQMNDFAMTDINDVFLYVAGTEGTGTYTDYVLDRNGSIADNVQNNPTQANRVRGLAPANVSLGNIETMGRVPIDAVGIDSIEVSRGPNANVFGLGNPSGTVNQVPSAANLQRDDARIVLRADSYDGYRNSVDVNKVIIKDKLAVRFQQVFQHEAFQRKPSGVDTERYNGMIKYQPFKNTTLSGSYFYYHAYGNRPNSMPPRDNISYWIQSGRPTWDPVTRVIHVNGQTIGPVTANTFPSSFNGQTIDYFSASYLGFDSSQLFIDQNGIGYWAAPSSVTGTTPATAAPGNLRYLQTTGAPDARGTGVRSNAQPLFLTTPTVSDQSIYDWENINISAINRFWDKTETFNVQLDQLFFRNAFHTLAFQGNFFREDSERWTRNYIGISNDLGQSGQLSIDPNERRLDGTPNPYFLRPYIGTARPRMQYDPARWDTTRGQLAYLIDFTQRNDGWRHLGSHQLTGYSEYKYRVNRRYSWRDVITSNHSWIPAGVYRGNQSTVSGPGQPPANINVTKSFYRYYVGDTEGANVDYAPSDFQYGAYDYVWGNAATGAFNREQVSLGLGAVTDSTGGTNNTKVTIRTLGGVMQSHFLGDRLVTTLGAREDKVYTMFGHTAVRLHNDGLTHDKTTTDRWSGDELFNSGRTTNVQAIVRPFRDLGFVRDLRNQSSFAADLINNLTLGYNKSDSFLPATPAQDLYHNRLPNPTGEDESYTLALNLFDNKLVVRATRYENTQKDARNSDASVFNQRVTRLDMSPSGQTPNPARLLFQADAWVRWQSPTLNDDQVRAKVTEVTGISPETEAFLFDPGVPFAATADIVAKGTEIEINYNPTNYWTVSGSITDSEVTNRNVSATIQRWIDERMPVWTTVKDPRIGVPVAQGGLDPTPGNTDGLWWKQLYQGASGSQTPEFNFIAFVGAPYSAFRENEGKANPQTRRYNARFSTKLDLAGITDQRHLKKFSIGGAIRLESKAIIGYYGVQQLPATITQLDTNRPIYDGAHHYLDAFITYRTKLWGDKVSAQFQLNARNLTESGGLRPVGAFPDGRIHTYRIIDPRIFILTASFDL